MEYLYQELTEKIIGLAIEVHKELGPGLLESIYKNCLAYELNLIGIPFELEKKCPVVYKNKKFDFGYRMDLFVDKKIIIELKSVDKILPIHEAQLLTYLKLSKCRLGLLINFNEKLLKNGIKRMIL